MTNEEGKELLDVLMDAGSKVTNERFKTAVKKEAATVRFVDGDDVYIRPMSDVSTPTVANPTQLSDLDAGDVLLPNETWQHLATGDLVEVVYAQSLNDGFIIRKIGDHTDVIFDKDVIFNGVVDVTNRRAYATLSSAGWYRVCTAKDVGGCTFDFSIGRPYNNVRAEAHKITFLIAGGGNSKFANESSASNVVCVDKIRCTYGDYLMHFDIHYNASYQEDIYIDYVVGGNQEAKDTCVSEELVSVVDAPVGETVVTTYTFTANGFVPNQSIINPYGNLAETGHRVATNPSAVSVSASTYKTVASLTLSAGMWCVFVTVQWAYSSTGRRRAFLSTTQDSSSANVGIMYTSEIKALNDGSANTFVNFAGPLEVSESTTYYVNTWQNSGGALSTTGRFYAMRIA